MTAAPDSQRGLVALHGHSACCQTHATGSLSDLRTVACRVAGGLDSLVMGEGQILAQVKQVHNVGQNCVGFGRHLNSLFRQAITAGERSHQVCPFGRLNTTVAYSPYSLH